MAMANKKGTIQLKGYTAAEWDSLNPILAKREVGLVTDSNPYKFKFGDGVTRWKVLPFGGGSDLTTISQEIAKKVGYLEKLQPLEIELVPTARLKGKISSVDGSVVASETDEHSGMIRVYPGEKLLVSLRSNEINPSPPATYTGLAGYATTAYNSFVSTPDGKGFKIGNLLNLYRFNAENEVELNGHVNFINVERTVPAGVNYIDGSSALEADGSGMPLSIKAIRNVGTLEESLRQLFDRSAGGRSGSGGSGVSQNEFTDAEKEKLASINLPVATWVTKGLGNSLKFIGSDNGETYTLYVKNDELVLEGSNRTLRSLPYLVGYSNDEDKTTAAYVKAVATGTIVIPENGMGTGHLQPRLKTGSPRFIPGGNTLEYDFDEGDFICREAIKNGQKVHGAHLTWHQTYNPNNPTGVNKQHVLDIITNNPGNEKAAISAYFQEIIPVIVNHFETTFPGTVMSWNVMNESISDSGGQTASVFAPYFTLDEWAEMAFTAAAKAAKPNVKLYINGYGYEEGNGNRIAKTISIIDTLKAKNIITPTGRLVQIEGIGSQMHAYMGIGEPAGTTGYGIEIFRDKLVQLADTGLMIMLTELDLRTGPKWDAAIEEQQARAYYKCFETYERAVPPAQRGGIVFWTVSDKSYIDNVGKGFTDPTGTNPATQYPGLYDWFYAPKSALQRIFDVLDRPQLTADVYQDFMVTPNMTDLVTAGASTKGLTPLLWKKAGYTAGNIGINDDGLVAKQTSQDSRTTIYVDYPQTNRIFIAKIHGLKSAGTRTLWIIFKYADESNSLRVQVNNSSDTYSVVKRVGGQDTTLIPIAQKPAKEDEIKVITVGAVITVYINNIQLGQVTDSALQSATKAGFAMKGFDDKSTTIDEFMVTKIV